MKYIIAKPENVIVKQTDWENTFNQFKSIMPSMPTVISGVTTLDQAEDWLECVAKTHNAQMTSVCIKQATGLGARDIRALVAHEEGEYYPALSPNEIYQSKQLKAFPASFNIAKNEEPFIINAVREVLETKNKIQRVPENENRMLEGKEGLWLKSRPALYGTINGEDIVIDIHINRGQDLTMSDEYRLHYHNLVATSIGLKPQSLFQANLQIEPALKQKLVEMASISKEAEKAAIIIIKEAMNNDSKEIQFSTRIVQQKQDTYEKLAGVGQKHWNDIKTGIQMGAVKEKEKLPEELNNEYTILSKTIIAAKFIKEEAERVEKQARQDMTDFAHYNDITKNVALPYEATTLNQNKKYELDRLFDVLTTKFNVAPSRLKVPVVDLDMHINLIEQARESGVPVTPEQMASTVKYEKLNEANIKTAAIDAGLDLNDYASVDMTVYISGQSRGPVRDALDQIKNVAADVVQNNVRDLTQSPILDSQNLKENLKGTGISFTQEF